MNADQHHRGVYLVGASGRVFCLSGTGGRGGAEHTRSARGSEDGPQRQQQEQPPEARRRQLGRWLGGDTHAHIQNLVGQLVDGGARVGGILEATAVQLIRDPHVRDAGALSAIRAPAHHRSAPRGPAADHPARHRARDFCRRAAHRGGGAPPRRRWNAASPTPSSSSNPTQVHVLREDGLSATMISTANFLSAAEYAARPHPPAPAPARC